MISGDIHRQRLSLVNEHIVAETIDYLEAKFNFKTNDWDGLEKWAHFSCKDTVYDIPLTDDGIRKEDHLCLSAGEWSFYLHGNRSVNGTVCERITTNTEILHVLPTGMLDGEPFPKLPVSAAERLFARVSRLETLCSAQTADTAESVVNRTGNARAMVTFADDDGVADVMSKLLPLSETYGIPFVSSMVTDRIGTDRYMTAEQLRLLQDAGWEIASHTMSHVDLGTLTDEEQEEQLRGSKEALEGIGIEVSTICYPFSGVTENTWRIARKYYRCGRQTNYKEWMNGTPLETWDLRVTPLGSYFETRTESGLDTGTLAYYKWMADKAAAENAWLIFLTHCSETNAEQMGYLAQTIEYVQELGLPVVTIREGLELRGNTVDVGRYDRLHPSAEHYVVGCDATIRKSDNDKYMICLPAGSVTNDTPPSAFPIPAVSTCRIVGNSAGFPFQVTHYGGTLITNTMGARPDRA